jgi:Fe-S cluster assembly protein SufD
MPQLVEQNTAAKGTHLTNFTRIEKEVAARPWVQDLRRAGLARFEAVGFPTNDQEEWRFTSLAALARTALRQASWPAAKALALAAEAARRHSFAPDAAAELVFVNGRFAPELSHLGGAHEGVQVRHLAAALAEDVPVVRAHLGKLAAIDANPLVALNAALFSDGALVHVRPGTSLDRPIHLLFVSAPDGLRSAVPELAMAQARVLLVIDEGASASIVETYVGAGDLAAYFNNSVTEIFAGPACQIDHCKVQRESAAAWHLASTGVSLDRDSAFVSHSVSIGSKLSRNDLIVTLDGPGAQATLNGLVLIGDGQHCDNHTLLDHAKAHCPSHELYKHVLTGKATGVFKGKILVRPDAQKTDSKQTSKSLLLSDDAIMHSQPMLEIYADDVKCTHGSTTGPVDDEMVFYLRTRGVDLAAARHLLTYAFAADITRRIKIEPVRRAVEDYMAAQAGLPLDLRITDLGRHDEKSR